MVINGKKLGHKKIISYSWTINPEVSHKISGHLFEAIDFYLSSKDYKILIPEVDELRINQCIKAIKYKYKEELLDDIFNAIIFGRPKILTADHLISCDGIPPECLCMVNTLELWLCGKDFWWTQKRLFGNNFKELIIRYQKFIYEPFLHYLEEIPNKFRTPVTFILDENFVKDIHPDNYLIPTNPKEQILIYVTGNCRSLGDLEGTEETNNSLNDILNTLNYIKEKHFIDNILMVGINEKDSKFLIYLKDKLKGFTLNIISEDNLPVYNFHNEFSIYLYTPTKLNWDCSSRLIRECRYYNKPIYFTDNVIKNVKENRGLKYLLDSQF